VRTFEVTPEDFGMNRAGADDVRGGDAGENARIIHALLDGEKGPKRDMVLLNAAAAFVAAGLDPGFREGIERGRYSIDSGAARGKLQALISYTRGCRPYLRNASRQFFHESVSA
jgi:anthranilate phosphoribosyltransferase